MIGLMTGRLFAPDSDAQMIEMALADPATASLDSAGAPVVVAAGQPPRLCFANGPALDLFGPDLDAITDRLFSGAEPGSQRLAQLAATLLPGASPRLERLRFYFGGSVEFLTVLCRRTAQDAGHLLVIGAPGVRAALLAPQRAKAAAAPAPVAVDEDHNHAPPPERATTRFRFVWRTDRNHCLTEVGPDFTAYLARRGSLEGRSFVDLLRDEGIDPDNRLVGALAARTTWSGIELDWPLDGGRRSAPVEFGAVPAFDAAKLFEGFRGYGLVHAERLVERAQSADPTLENAAEQNSEPAGPVTPQADVAPASLAVAEPAPTAIDSHPAASDELASATPAQVVVGDSLPSAVESGDHPFARETAAAVEPSPEAATETPAPQVEAPIYHSNVVPLRPAAPGEGATPALSPSERNAFDEISRALASLSTAGASLADPTQSAQAQPSANTPTPTEPAAPSHLALRAIIDRVPIGILVTRQSIPLLANRTLLDLTGYRDIDALHESGGLERLFRDTPASGETEPAATTIACADGDTVTVDARVQAIDWDGLPASLVSLRRAVDRETTLRLRALETTVREGEDELRDLHAILDTATDGVVLLDGEGHVRSLNRSAEALFGTDQADVLNQSISALVAPDSHAAVSDYLASLRDGGVASVLNDGREILCRGPRGGTIPVFMTIGRVGVGEPPRFCAVLRDLTEWKKAERSLNEARHEAERASALKSDFLAKISHEIRTPLNAILGFAEVIMDERFGPVGNERYKDYMKDIHRSGEHVMSLVNDLLDLSKIEAGKMDMTFTATDANSVVSECVSLMQPQASRERVLIRLSLAPRLPKIVADERAFRQIVLNVLSNAIKYNEPGGQVIVSTALTDAGHAVVRVRDTGLGMTEAELQTALEPFRQVATSRKTNGTGLGLPLTKALVEANRASFSIKSRKDEGTLVEIAFPPSRVMAG